MTPNTRNEMMRALDRLAACYRIDFEMMLQEMATSFKEQSFEEEHPAVRSCLEGVSEDLSRAAFNLYASYK